MNALSLLYNYADSSLLTPSSEVATGRAKNVLDPQRSLVWRAIGTQHYLDFTIPFPVQAGQEITHVALVDLNLTSAGEIHVEAWTDGIDGSDSVVDITAAPWLLSEPLSISLPFGGGYFGLGPFGASPDANALNGRNVTLIALPAETGAQFWRITLTDTNVSYIQCSRVYLARATVFTTNISFGWSASFDDPSVFKPSIGGQRFVQPRDGSLILEPSYDWLSDAERTAQLINLRRFGSWRPLIFSISPEATDEGIALTVYGHYENAGVRHTNLSINQFAFRIVEEL